MIINDVFVNVSCQQIVEELQSQMRVNNLPYIQKIVPVPRENPKSLQINCPYHKGGTEHKPSAGIRMSDGMFHCFSCDEIHSLPEVISYCFGRDDAGIFGMSWITRNFGIVEKEERKDVEIDLERPNLSRKSVILDNSNNSKSKWVTEEELDKYRYYHPYWKTRGIVDEDIIELFDLGIDFQTNEITMPNYDINGRCVFVARRSIKNKFFSYPASVEKIVYGIYQLYQLGTFPKDIYITESMIDCIYLWQFNKYACALNGLGTKSQFEQLNKMPCRHFILATDNDDAGMKARERLRKNIKNKLITEVILPNGKKDINECTKDEILHLQEIF